MTESEWRGEGLAEEQQKVDAFQTALYALVEDASAEGLPLVSIAIELRTQANRLTALSGTADAFFDALDSLNRLQRVMMP